MNRVIKHLRTNLIAYLALFVALGGTSYAAFQLPAGSVGTRQLRNHSVTPVKFGSNVGAYVGFWAVVGPNGQLLAARPQGGRIVAWDPVFHTGLLRWPSLSRSCFALATGSEGFVRALVLPGPGTRASVQFETYSPVGQPTSQQADIGVFCPQK
jgi:hypothetical protein